MSRHDATGDLIFQKRKSFFRLVLDRCGIKHSCKIIHVAGTKGKGSTVEYISSGLIGSNNNVGVFSSPHLHTARERIKIGREIISIEDLTRIGKQTLSLFEDCNWSYVMFDKMVTVALYFFGERDVDYMILETGKLIYRISC
jgi:dihydrofolate synthase/folylpolyglutamate synthase